jgi:hypothetical protein
VGSHACYIATTTTTTTAATHALVTQHARDIEAKQARAHGSVACRRQPLSLLGAAANAMVLTHLDPMTTALLCVHH